MGVQASCNLRRCQTYKTFENFQEKRSGIIRLLFDFIQTSLLVPQRIEIKFNHKLRINT